MRHKDSCQRFLFEDSDIRGELVNLTGSFKEVMNKKVYPGQVRNLLGQFLAASVLMSSTIKFAGRLVLQAKSGGEVPLIMAECTSDLTVRGIARYSEEPSATDFHQLLENGTLALTIEPEEGEPWQGIVPLEGENLAQCLESYFRRSEQLPTLLLLAVNEDRCSGLLLQQLPANKHSGEEREEDWNTVRQLASTLTSEEMLSLDNETILYRLFHEMRVKLFDLRPVIHKCSCSRERIASALLTLGEAELRDILEEQGSVDINCEFCAARYSFDPADIELLFGGPGERQLH